MRTTLDLPEGLVEDARRLLGFKSKTDTIVMALTELIRRRRIDELKAMAGTIKLDLDLPASRRRPGRQRRVAASARKAARASSSAPSRSSRVARRHPARAQRSPRHPEPD